jgi:tripartite-type tricarboxylate transporter receptor subunit TctC
MRGTHGKSAPLLRHAAILLGIAALMQVPPPAAAQSSQRPIRFVTTAPGSGNDFTIRLMSPGLTAALGRQIIVDNRAGLVVPGSIVAKAPGDGSTLLILSSTLWIAPLLQPDVPYDPVRDFSPISMVTTAPNVLVVHPSLPVKSTQELITYAKGRPGQLNFGVTVLGGSIHLAGELFASLGGLNMVRVPFKGVGDAVTAQLSGEVQVMFPVAVSARAHMDSGKMRGLAVSSREATALVPGLPPVSATLPGFEAVTMTGVWAPKSTPETVIRRMHAEIVAALNLPEVKDRLFAAGSEVVGSTPQEFAATMKADMTKWARIMKETRIGKE